jgi:hypothetical protein
MLTEKDTEIIKYLALMGYEDLSTLIIATVVLKTKTTIEAVGLLETIKNNLVLNLMDKKMFMRDLKKQIDKDSFLDNVKG